MKTVTISIEGNELEVEQEKTVMEAALQHEIYIPHLCYHPSLKSQGACRLCLVEIKGNVVPSCLTRVENGMDIKIKSRKVDEALRPVVELLVSQHHADCRGCPGNKKCEFQKVMAYFRIDRKRVQRLRAPHSTEPLEKLNPFIDRDANRCIMCGICVQTCEEAQQGGFLYFLGRGIDMKLAYYGDANKCVNCMLCVERCPVVALLKPEAKTE